MSIHIALHSLLKSGVRLVGLWDFGFGGSWTPKRTGIMGLQPAGLHESSILDEELKIKYSDMHTSSGFHFIFTFIQTSL